MNTIMHFKKQLAIPTILTAVLFLCLNVKAQRLSLTGSLGASNYLGDLSNGSTPPFKLDISGGATYDLTNSFRLRLNASYLSVEGDDKLSKYAYIRTRNLNFKSNIEELALLGEYDLVDNSFNNIIPYVFLGTSFYHFDPYALRKPTDPGAAGSVNLHYIGTEGQFLTDSKGKLLFPDRQYSRNQLNIQYGAGIRFELSERVSIGVEANMRKLFTDYLDDVSANSYITKDQWEAGKTYLTTSANAANNYNKDLLFRLTQAEKYFSWRYVDSKGNPIPLPETVSSTGALYPRGNPSKNDAYYSFQIRLNIRLNALAGGGNDFYSPRNPNGRKQLRCAKIRNKKTEQKFPIRLI